MQDQPCLGKAKPQEDDGEDYAGTIDQGRKAAIDHCDLGSPRADPGLVFGNGCQQPLETLLRLAEVASQHVPDVRQKGGGTARKVLEIGDFAVQGVGRLQKARELFLARDRDGEEGPRVDVF